MVTTNWFGLAGPARVPDDIVGRMYAEVARALASPDLLGRFGDIGVEPGGEPPAEAQAFVLAEIERWTAVVRATGVTIN